jgi:hypothetical protein
MTNEQTYEHPTYFKYTSGEIFTLNSINYVGFFHINEKNEVFSEKYHSNTSERLNGTKTFLSEIYTNKIELNTTFGNIESLMDYYPTTLDILNKEELSKLTNNINYNNLITFKRLVIDNPYIYNFDSVKNHFYALNFNNEMISYPISDYYGYTHVDDFSRNTTWNFLDDIKIGIFVVDSDKNFKYLCSSGSVNYIIDGGFVPNTPLSISEVIDLAPNYSDEVDYTYDIYHDVDDNKISYVNSEYIFTYDSSNLSDCNRLFLIDKIKIPNNSVEKGHYIWNLTNKQWNTEKLSWNDRIYVIPSTYVASIKFGNNIRTSILDNILTIYNKYSNDIFQTIDLNKYSIGDILSLDVRNIDDLIVILNRKNDDIYLCILDILNLEVSKNIKISSIKTDSENYKVVFSNIDSDIIYVSNRKEYQTRHISNPTYPSGRIELGNLLYYEPYKWNTAFEKYNKILVRWDSGANDSNQYNNLNTFEIINNGIMYFILHNIGRIYTIYQSADNRLISNVPLNLSKTFSGINCSESSIGLYLNTNLSSLIKDMFTIYSSSYGAYNISEYSVNGMPLNDISFTTNNLYLNGNETVDVIPLQRMINSIRDIQSNLIQTT